MPTPRIEELRREIDKIDLKIVNLLNKRAKLSVSVKEIKEANSIQVLDAKRENEILEAVAALAESPLDEPTVKEIFKLILKRYKQLG